MTTPANLGDRIESGDYELSADERRALAALKRVEKQWPDTLWLFSAAGSLCVMRKGADGDKAYRDGLNGGVDQRYILDGVDIENDGGDW